VNTTPATASVPITAPSSAPIADERVAESFWVSLRYFNGYRLAIGGLFLVSSLLPGNKLGFGEHSPQLFLAASAGYVFVAAAFHVVLHRFRHHFDAQLTAHVCADVIATMVLTYASGGFRSGLAVMLFISIAAASLVSRGRHLLFYAALASIGVLLEQTIWVVLHGENIGGYLPAGLISIGYFATAIVTNRLAQRVIANERVARQRGIDLANQLRINELVVRDFQDGVLVVDEHRVVRSRNPRVDQLLSRTMAELRPIAEYSPELAHALDQWRGQGGPGTLTVTLPGSGLHVRARFVEAGVQGATFTVIYLEDLSKLEEQARQLKLAALGRLTANIAHEIRNPLAAITHATDLLAEENRQPGRERLTRIVQDNVRRLDRMVKDILELSRRDRVHAEPIRLGQFLAAFLEEYAHNEQVDRDGFAIEVAGDGVVEVDRVHLHQVLWNLVRNAWRHSRQQRGSVCLRLVRLGNQLELHVIDDGPGVAKALRTQLFEPFFTTYSGGTGLGLYIARELCAANGASLDYVDTGSGADFCVAWQGVRA
jgi:two-component system sensor histidine kinase PilS (NtrC family)